MKTSTFVLGAVVGVVAAITIVISCADSTSPGCDLADCTSQCQAAGHLGGDCRAGACYCTETSPDADADTPDTVDTADIIDTPPDPGPDETALPDIRDEATTPDEYVREEFVREDYTSTTEDGGGGTDGDAKSGGCDPLVCFMTCGGTCAADGTCVCESPAP